MNHQDRVGVTCSLGLCLSDQVVCARFLRAARRSGIPANVLSDQSVRDWVSRTPEPALVVDRVRWPQVRGLAARWRSDTESPRVALLDVPESESAHIAASMIRGSEPLTDADAANLLDRLRDMCPALPSARSHGSRKMLAPPVSAADTTDPAYAQLSPVLHHNVDVLITGETGTGKEVLARHIHSHYAPQAPFVAVNCAAIPEALAESELFGHEAGAFTGALKARTGHFAEANGGVLFLDEIDSCPLWLQAKLLRAIQDRGAHRLGSSVFRPSRFRLIASAQRPLSQLVEEGRFRSDLYFRLAVVEVRLTPLRHQHERLLRVFELMCSEISSEYGHEFSALSAEEQATLLARPWPGNLRELRAAALRRVLGWSPKPADSAVAAPSLKSQLLAYEKALVSAALQRRGGNVASAARELGMPVASLHYRLRRLGISAEEADAGARDIRE